MAKASKFTVVEVEELVDVGELKPEEIHVSAAYVDAVVVCQGYEKRIEVCIRFVCSLTHSFDAFLFTRLCVMYTF
jgi:acyl CoA:acetate/3-ketoacid CoA transferase